MKCKCEKQNCMIWYLVCSDLSLEYKLIDMLSDMRKMLSSIANYHSMRIIESGDKHSKGPVFFRTF